MIVMHERETVKEKFFWGMMEIMDEKQDCITIKRL
jgi:hypothetical protein